MSGVNTLLGMGGLFQKNIISKHYWEENNAISWRM
jgi:hypothetical protein